jgi:hypothetical protein
LIVSRIFGRNDLAFGIQRQHAPGGCGGRCGSLTLVLYLLLAFVKALHNRRSPWYLRGLIREPLRQIGVVLLHDVEHRFLDEPAMVLGK